METLAGDLRSLNDGAQNRTACKSRPFCFVLQGEGMMLSQLPILPS